MSVSTVCPYCRNAFPIENPAAPRAVCPRCGETVPVRLDPDDESMGPSVSPPSGAPASPRWFKPALFASCVVSVLVFMGGLWWVFSDNPQSGGPTTDRSADGLQPPIALAGLGYLPGSVQVVAAVRPGSLVLLGEATRTDPRQRLAESGVPKPVLDAFDRLGVPLSQIDHAAVGLTLPTDAAFPQIVMAFVLNQSPADEAATWKAIGAERTTGGEHPRYKATLGGLPVQVVRARPTVYVFATEPKALDGVENARPSNGEHLRPRLREALVNRLSPASFAWVVAEGDDRWVELPAVKFLAKVTKREDLLVRFASGRACAIGISLEPEPWLRVSVNAEDARPVGDWFAQQLAGERTEVEPGDGWATVVTPCALQDVAAKIGKLIPAAKK